MNSIYPDQSVLGDNDAKLSSYRFIVSCIREDKLNECRCTKIN